MKRFRIENQDYGTSIFTRSLPEAQQYLRAHPDEVVKVWHGDLLLAETPASVEARERAAAIVTVNNAKEAMIDKEAIINLAYRLRREIGHNACLPPQERHREAVATARSLISVAVGKSSGTGYVTLPIPAHWQPRISMVWNPMHRMAESGLSRQRCPSMVT